ncbi:MAG: acetate kinase, partial [Pseudomonadota bacterium]
GGAEFSAPALVDAGVLARIEALSALAPLHNPPAVSAIRAVMALAPAMPQIACFDTAFHARQPEVASAYALPAEQRAAGYRRYGFHGLSYQGLVERLPGILGTALPARVLALHLGNGASVCAIREGMGVATSMGFSPLEGLTMGTRSGSVDPALVLRIARERGIDETERLLLRESGLKGLSGGISDMRALEAAGTPEADFAIAHFCHWAARHGGSAIAAMEGVDLLAFTGGIGEHAHAVRARIVELLAWTGAPAVVVPADEEVVLAASAAALLGAGSARS